MEHDNQVRAANGWTVTGVNTPYPSVMKRRHTTGKDGYPAKAGCENCLHCKEHEYIYECKIGRATECTWENSFKLWEPKSYPDFIEEEEMTI